MWLPFGSIISLWRPSAYFQSIHTWKNRCSLLNRQFPARSLYNEAIVDFISEGRKIGDLPLAYKAACVRAASK